MVFGQHEGIYCIPFPGFSFPTCPKYLGKVSRSVISDSLQPHRLYSPRNSPEYCIAFPFSRGSSQPKDQTCFNYIKYFQWFWEIPSLRNWTFSKFPKGMLSSVIFTYMNKPSSVGICVCSERLIISQWQNNTANVGGASCMELCRMEAKGKGVVWEV